MKLSDAIEHVRQKITIASIRKSLLVFGVIFTSMFLMFSLSVWAFRLWFHLSDEFMFPLLDHFALVAPLTVCFLFTFLLFFVLQYLFQEE